MSDNTITLTDPLRAVLAAGYELIRERLFDVERDLEDLDAGPRFAEAERDLLLEHDRLSGQVRAAESASCGHTPRS